MAHPVEEAREFRDYLAIIGRMYDLGWDERNGGNVSYLLSEETIEKYLDGGKKIIRKIPLPMEADPIMKGRVILCTGTGKFFRNVPRYPSECVGIFRIADNLKEVELLYGFDNNACFTSEIYAHLMCHATRLKKDPENRVILHTHPTNLIALSQIHSADDRELTVDLWRMMTECVVVFPDGIGVLPWMVCGTDEIGRATAKKMEEHRLVLWSIHGIYGAGPSLDDAFGLVETAEKAAEIYLKVLPYKLKNIMTDKDIKAVAKRFDLTPFPGYLS